MPFSIKIYLADSPLHGKGLFAGQDIPKGTIIWTFLVEESSMFSEDFGKMQNTEFLTQEYFKNLSPEQCFKIINGSWAHQETQKLLKMVDGCQYINHSQNFNSEYVTSNDYRKAYSFATRDIKEGEQIIQSYGKYKKTSIPWVRDLLQKCDPGRIELQEGIKQKI